MLSALVLAENTLHGPCESAGTGGQGDRGTGGQGDRLRVSVAGALV